MKHALFVTLAITITFLSAIRCSKDHTFGPIYTLQTESFEDFNNYNPIFDFATRNEGMFIVGELVFVTHNGGLTWERTQSPDDYSSVSISYPVADTGYVFMYPPQEYTHCYRITGQGWIMDDMHDLGYMAVPAFCNGTTGLLYSRLPPSMYYLLLRTTDCGANWTVVDSTMSFDKLEMNSETFAYGESNDIFYYTTDGGYNWTQSASNCKTFSRIDEQGVGYYLDRDGKLFKTTDFAVSWNLFWSDPGGFDERCVTHAGNLIVAGGVGPLIISRDGGQTWNYYNVLRFGDDTYKFFNLHIVDDNTIVASGEHAGDGFITRLILQ